MEKLSEDNIRKIHEVSSCFCLAKWLQVTIDLVHGTTHSCHHPEKHEIPLSELANSPAALHNTRFKKEQRRRMLLGERPDECAYCWNIEAAPDSGMSDRLIKSTDPWALSEIDAIRQLSWDADVLPTYVEVMLDSACNLSCAYCMADVSTSVAKEMKRYGPYPVRHHAQRMPRPGPAIQGTPFLDAFWRWLPALMPSLRVLRITGGEPLFSSRLQPLLDFLATRSNPLLTLILNSHLSHDESVVRDIAIRIKELLRSGNIAKFELYTSLDTHGVRAEYIRSGMDYQKVLRNIELWASLLPELPIVVMCAFSILSIGSFRNFLGDILRLKTRFPRVALDISYLHNPNYLRANMADDYFRNEMAEALLNMKGATTPGFSEHEIMKLVNVVAWARRPPAPAEALEQRRDFFRFVQEYDRRKGTSFLAVFPEYREFLILCKAAALDHAFLRSSGGTCS